MKGIYRETYERLEVQEQGEGIILSREVKVGVNSKNLKDMRREPWRFWGAELTCPVGREGTDPRTH